MELETRDMDEDRFNLAREFFKIILCNEEQTCHSLIQKWFKVICRNTDFEDLAQSTSSLSTNLAKS